MSKALQELSSELRHRIPAEASFNAEFTILRYGRDVEPGDRLIKYILSELDYYYRKDDGIEYDSWTIEHLAPQSNLANRRRLEIGNLILVSSDVNGKLGTLAVTDKVKLLKLKGYTLDPQLDAAVQWVDKDIEARAKFLAKLAYDTIWKF